MLENSQQRVTTKNPTRHSEARLSMWWRQTRTLLPGAQCHTYSVPAPEAPSQFLLCGKTTWLHIPTAHGMGTVIRWWVKNTGFISGLIFLFSLAFLRLFLHHWLLFKTNQTVEQGNKFTSSLPFLWTSTQLRTWSPERGIWWPLACLSVHIHLWYKND